jgi:hypothetical protein
VLANYFLRRIALDPLTARVPVHDHPVRIEHVQRIIRHAADQQAELRLAVT